MSDLTLGIEEARRMTLDQAIEHSHLVLDTVSAGHNIIATLGLFSGGNDSTTFMHLFRDRFDHAVHVDTGIGIPETREYVEATCATWGLNLIVKSLDVGVLCAKCELPEMGVAS